MCTINKQAVSAGFGDIKNTYTHQQTLLIICFNHALIISNLSAVMLFYTDLLLLRPAIQVIDYAATVNKVFKYMR